MIKKTALLTFFAFSSICAGGEESNSNSAVQENKRIRAEKESLNIRLREIMTQMDSLRAKRQQLIAEEDKKKALLQTTATTQRAIEHLDFTGLKAILSSKLHSQALHDEFLGDIIAPHFVDYSTFDNIIPVLEFLSANGLKIEQLHCWTNEYKIHKILKQAFAQNKKQLCHSLLTCVYNNFKKLIFDPTCSRELITIAISVNHLPFTVAACTRMGSNLAISWLRDVFIHLDKSNALDMPMRIFIINRLNGQSIDYAFRCAQYDTCLKRNRITLTRILKTGPHNSEHEAITIINKQNDIIKRIVELSLPEKPVPILLDDNNSSTTQK